MLGSAGVLGGVGRKLLAMYLNGARGTPVRLKSRQMETLVREGSVAKTVSEALISFFADVGNDESDALNWRKLIFVVCV